MKKLIVSAALTMGLFAWGQSAAALSLGLTTELPLIEASFAEIDYAESGSDGDLSTFGADVDFTDGVTLTDPAFILFGFGFSLADPTDAPGGGFTVFDDDGFNEALAGDLIDIGFFDDTIELLFGSLTGSVASDFGSLALMTIFFDDALGADPFAAFVDGDFYTASISIESVAVPNVVPLPAGAALLLTGVAGVVGMSRRKASLGKRSA